MLWRYIEERQEKEQTFRKNPHNKRLQKKKIKKK